MCDDNGINKETATTNTMSTTRNNTILISLVTCR